MPRTIKRYESRKLYDATESRYIGLSELADHIRAGEEIEVLDNASGEDVTAQTLAQIILEERRSGRSFLSKETLHEIVRVSEEKIQSGAAQVQRGIDRLVRASVEALPPMREARQEIDRLRARLDAMEASLAEVEAAASATRRGARRKKAVAVPPIPDES